MKRKVIAAIVFYSLAGCMQNQYTRPAYINAPVDLTIVLVTAGTYQLNFYSDNREGGFSGYGIFTGSTVASVAQTPDQVSDDITAAQAFCALAMQSNAATPVFMQIGAAANSIASGGLCDITPLTLVSGSYVALRARVERSRSVDNPYAYAWSAATYVQVP